MSVENSRHFDALNQIVVTAVRTVMPTGAIVETTTFTKVQWGPWLPPSFSMGACVR